MTSTLYFHTDALGSVRRVTNQSGAEVKQHDYLPFGQEYNPSPVVAGNTLRYTGKERDNETEVQAQALHPLDYFGARYYQGQIGRFTSVDPDHVSGTVVDPQSWNGYSYGRNNPLRFTDPDGQRFEICVDGMIGCSSVTDDKFFGDCTESGRRYPLGRREDFGEREEGGNLSTDEYRSDGRIIRGDIGRRADAGVKGAAIMVAVEWLVIWGDSNSRGYSVLVNLAASTALSAQLNLYGATGSVTALSALGAAMLDPSKRAILEDLVRTFLVKAAGGATGTPTTPVKTKEMERYRFVRTVLDATYRTYKDLK